MHFGKLGVLLGLVGPLSASVMRGHRARDGCPAPTPGPNYEVHYFPIYVDTYISAATVFNVNGNANITINNAPTSLQTVIQGTSTVTVTSTTTATVTPTGGTTPPPPVTPTTFFLLIGGAVTRKRQAQGYFDADGDEVFNCAAASTFSINPAGQLTSGGSIFSVPSGVTDAVFREATSFNPGDISTTFAVGANGDLVWGNSAFPTGSAAFCVTPDNVVHVTFTAAGLAGCTPISLTAVPPVCPNSPTTSPTTSAAPSPTSVSPTPNPTAPGVTTTTSSPAAPVPSSSTTTTTTTTTSSSTTTTTSSSTTSSSSSASASPSCGPVNPAQCVNYTPSTAAAAIITTLGGIGTAINGLTTSISGVTLANLSTFLAGLSSTLTSTTGTVTSGVSSIGSASPLPSYCDQVAVYNEVQTLLSDIEALVTALNAQSGTIGSSAVTTVLGPFIQGLYTSIDTTLQNDLLTLLPSISCDIPGIFTTFTSTIQPVLTGLGITI